MDNGPRIGDVFIENDYPVGSAMWHEIEANNALYRYRKNRPMPPPSPNDVLIMKLIKHFNGIPLEAYLKQFTKKNK